MKDKRFAGLFFLLMIFCFCIFFISFNQYKKNWLIQEMDRHSKVIKENVWATNYTGITGYLTLAAEHEDYSHIELIDTFNQNILTIEGAKLTGLDYILDMTRLLPQTIITSDIKYDGHVIGTLIAHHRNMAFYIHFYVFLLFILIYTVVIQFRKIVQVKIGLEDHVRKRTEELNDANLRLSKNVEILNQAQRMESIGSLAGGIAHDFNNLLFPIMGMSEMLLEDLPKDSLEHENAQEIFKAGKRAGDLVKQILAFSRQSEHKMTPVRIHNILKEVLKLTRSTIPSNIEIQENIDRNCGLIMADATKIHQVAMNLITNAFHAIEEKNGIIDVSLKKIDFKNGEIADSILLSGRYIQLSVTDNGIGMSQSIQNKIFDPYFTTKEVGKGTGLGLAVVYGIIKEHNGDIKVYSEEGNGSTFNVYLPLMKTSATPILNNQSFKLPTGTEKILLVDDEISVAKIEGQMLSRLGYQVTEQTNSSEALNDFKANPENFDLVISDMTMPNMTGDQLAREILSIRPDMPIIICTGFSERVNKEQAEAIGVKGFLMKPVIKYDMAQIVRNVLDKAKNL